MREKGGTLILGSYGYGNMGDEAILQGLLEGSELALDKVDVVSATPSETKRLHGVNAIFKRNICYDNKYSTVLLGGGGYTPGAYERPLTIALRLNAGGARIVVRALGPSPEVAGKEVFGPDELGGTERNLLTEILNRSEYFSVRTNRDMERVRKYTKSDKTLIVERCPAYDISFSKKRGVELLKMFGYSTETKLCGVSLAKFGYRKGIRNFIKKYENDYTLVPIPMCRHYYATFENDSLLLRKYFGELKLLSRNTVRMLRYPFTPSELKCILANLSFLITARKHAMILALGGGLDSSQIIMLGTRNSGLSEYFHVKEIDWRQWAVSPDGFSFFMSKRKQDILGNINWLLTKLHG